MKRMIIFLLALSLHITSSTIFAEPAIQKADLLYLEDLLKIPVKNMSSFRFDPESRLESRIAETPAVVLDYLRKMDNRPDYKNHTCTKQERSVIELYINSLPLFIQKVLSKRLIGFFFVDNFQGSGLADYAVDRQGTIFAFIVINPKVIEYDISTWLTAKENTCFKKEKESDIEIFIDCGTEYLAFLYILLHESSHVIDYVNKFTPCVEEGVALLQSPFSETNRFVAGIWDGYSTPAKPDSITDRRNITFYYLNNGPKISMNDVPELYKELSQSPFVSLYGTLSWAEDFAEFCTFYYLTQYYSIEYKIIIRQKGKPDIKYTPFTSTKIQARIPCIKSFLLDQ